MTESWPEWTLKTQSKRELIFTITLPKASVNLLLASDFYTKNWTNEALKLDP